MAVMGRYCRVYPLTALAEYERWAANVKDYKPEQGIHPDYAFVQENYVVTSGVLLDEQIIFDAVTPEWQEFCVKVLQFEVPSELLEDEDDTAIEAAADTPEAVEAVPVS